MEKNNFLNRIQQTGILVALFFFSNCFVFPVAPTKSQLHRIVESCIVNAAGCVSVSEISLPEINIQVNNIDYPNNSTFDFGLTTLTPPPYAVATFTIQNLGQANLNLKDISNLSLGKANINSAVISNSIVVISGTDTSMFTITQPTTTIISAGSSITFSISFEPTLAGAKTASISISSDDTDENPYIINLQGEGDIPK